MEPCLVLDSSNSRSWLMGLISLFGLLLFEQKFSNCFLTVHPIRLSLSLYFSSCPFLSFSLPLSSMSLALSLSFSLSLFLYLPLSFSKRQFLKQSSILKVYTFSWKLQRIFMVRVRLPFHFRFSHTETSPTFPVC